MDTILFPIVATIGGILSIISGIVQIALYGALTMILVQCIQHNFVGALIQYLNARR